jgi:hypothetical protein
VKQRRLPERAVLHFERQHFGRAESLCRRAARLLRRLLRALANHSALPGVFLADCWRGWN